MTKIDGGSDSHIMDLKRKLNDAIFNTLDNEEIKKRLEAFIVTGNYNNKTLNPKGEISFAEQNNPFATISMTLSKPNANIQRNNQEVFFHELLHPIVANLEDIDSGMYNDLKSLYRKMSNLTPEELYATKGYKDLSDEEKSKIEALYDYIFGNNRDYYYLEEFIINLLTNKNFNNIAKEQVIRKIKLKNRKMSDDEKEKWFNNILDFSSKVAIYFQKNKTRTTTGETLVDEILKTLLGTYQNSRHLLDVSNIINDSIIKTDTIFMNKLRSSAKKYFDIELDEEVGKKVNDFTKKTYEFFTGKNSKITFMEKLLPHLIDVPKEFMNIVNLKNQAEYKKITKVNSIAQDIRHMFEQTNIKQEDKSILADFFVTFQAWSEHSIKTYYDYIVNSTDPMVIEEIRKTVNKYSNYSLFNKLPHIKDITDEYIDKQLGYKTDSLLPESIDEFMKFIVKKYELKKEYDKYPNIKNYIKMSILLNSMDKYRTTLEKYSLSDLLKILEIKELKVKNSRVSKLLYSRDKNYRYEIVNSNEVSLMKQLKRSGFILHKKYNDVYVYKRDEYYYNKTLPDLFVRTKALEDNIKLQDMIDDEKRNIASFINNIDDKKDFHYIVDDKGEIKDIKYKEHKWDIKDVTYDIDNILIGYAQNRYLREESTIRFNRDIGVELAKTYANHYKSNPKLFKTITDEDPLYERIPKETIESFEEYLKTGVELKGNKNNPQYANMYADQLINAQTPIDHKVKGVFIYPRFTENYIFGSNVKSIVDYARDSKKLSRYVKEFEKHHGKLVHYFKIMEKHYTDIITAGKHKTIMKNPAVYLGNIESNIDAVMSTNISLTDTIRLLDKTNKEFERVKKLELTIQKEEAKLLKIPNHDKEAKKKQKLRIEGMRKKLESEDIYFLLQMGALGSLQEDSDGLDTDDKSRLENFFSDKVDMLGGSTKRVIDELYANKGTKTYQFGLDMTIKGDFLARAIIYKKMMEDVKRKYGNDQFMYNQVKKQIAYEVINMFINYSKPLPESLEYLNSIGKFVYAKYFLNAAHSTKVFAKYPTNVLLSIIKNETIDNASIMDTYSGNPLDWASRRWINTEDAFLEPMTPIAWDLYKSVENILDDL